ncbi:unnamed protein product [Rotaria sp. Silwood1]|nr:unnamed protein product [Rotaria sp. Silwood1]
MYIADFVNSQILRWPPNSNSGECIVACTGISGVGIDMLYGPFALAFDSYGSLFISDGNINRVQKFQILSGFDETSTTTITITDHTTSLQASSKSNRTHSSTIAISIAVLGNGKHTLTGICDRLLKKNEEIDLMFCVIKPNATAKVRDAFKAQYKSKASDAERAFKEILLFDTKQQKVQNKESDAKRAFKETVSFDTEQHEAQSYHFVFVLDESGSMSPHWNKLQQAYNNFLTRRNDDQGGDDVITVVQFDSSARTICSRQKVIDAPRTLYIHGGGTDYAQGLKEATKEIEKDKTGASIVMTFMSDGADCGNGNPKNIISQLKSKYKTDHNFICHTIGFSEGIQKGSKEEKRLDQMASNGGGKKYMEEQAMH